jgi:hypothetical protein
MGRRDKRRKTLKQKRTETFQEQCGLSPKEFLDKLNTLPNDVRTKQNIREAKALA